MEQVPASIWYNCDVNRWIHLRRRLTVYGAVMLMLAALSPQLVAAVEDPLGAAHTPSLRAVGGGSSLALAAKERGDPLTSGFAATLDTQTAIVGEHAKDGVFQP